MKVRPDRDAMAGFILPVFQSPALVVLDIDECQNGLVCQQNAACLNLPGSYRCDCKPGYRFTPTGQCLGKAVTASTDGPGRTEMLVLQAPWVGMGSVNSL